MTIRRGQRASDYPHRQGQLLARPEQTSNRADASHGVQLLGLSNNRDGLIYVPPDYAPDDPAPLAVMLHGAGGNSRHGLDLLQRFADAAGMILLAPDSRSATWDVIASDYGPDVAFIDRALKQTFERYHVDSSRLAVGGFSDGASYALSLGLINGDLFSHVIAFSPGFMAPTRVEGKPRIYISHGIHDTVLAIASCSRRIVPQLQRAEYNVLYHEFDGPHSIPFEISREAADWFTG